VASPFRPFGPDHLSALVLTAALAVAACAVVRRWPASRLARGLAPGLALGLAASVIVWAGFELARGRISPWQLLPLHLCDLLILIAVAALLTRRVWLSELLYFWSGAGALVAMLSPDVARGFPDPYFLLFFGLHAAVVVAAALLTFGHGIRPRPGAAWRVFGLTLAYAAAVALVNLALDANFMYLRRKPSSPTLLDWLGPWPWYLVLAGLLGLALFHLLEQPFRVAVAPARGPGRMAP
jgi:hypothetical integral membrane protein (TIGR02206 family)